MSQENVEIVRAAIDAFNREDWDSALEDAAPDFKLDMSRAVGPLRGVYELDQALRLIEEFAGSWDSVRLEPHEFREAGEQVVVPWTAHSVGRDGIEVRARVTWTWTVRNGAIERLCMFQERQEALEAAGLRGVGDVGGEREVGPVGLRTGQSPRRGGNDGLGDAANDDGQPRPVRGLGVP
jgi:ketosteroid isomerase-like protein